MNADVVLHWMTHIGEGSWSTFRSAVTKIFGSDADIDALCRQLRVVLSDLGHADFFVNESQHWQILPPVLAGLTTPMGAALLTGGRTPRLADAILGAAAAHGCRVTIQNDEYPISRILVEGTRPALAKLAAEVGIVYVDRFASTNWSAISPVPVQMQNARLEPPPANWSIRSFDFASLTWVEGLQRRSACEYQSRYGPRRFYVHTRHGQLLRLPKREAVYAAATLRNANLAAYDSDFRTLSTPAAAPLPESLARAACLCTATPAQFKDGRLLYAGVPWDVASVLLVSAGQPYPQIKQPERPSTRQTEESDGRSL